MTALGAGLRWLNLLAGICLVGIFTASLLAGPRLSPTARGWEEGLGRWARRLAALALLSGLGLLAHQSAHLAGRPAAALEVGTWLGVLLETRWGTVWLLRHVLLLLLAALLLLREREASRADWAALRVESWMLGVAALAALGWAGHAAAVEPGALPAALVDMAHLIATGIWLGTLLPLSLFCRAASREAGADSRPCAVLAVRRFSGLALAAILLLLATGAGNMWSQVGGVPALVGTSYGRLLLLKLALVLAILVVARRSRGLLPSLSGEAARVGRPAMAHLGHLVGTEWTLGVLVLVIASTLVATPPARHENPSWPLSFRLSYDAALGPTGPRTRVLVGSQVAVVGLLALVVGALIGRRRGLVLGSGAAATAAGLILALPPMTVDAYPTTYRRPAVAYHAGSVVKGMALYGKHCAECHGAVGQGDGARGSGLAKRPADLTGPHTAAHTAGDIFWWLTHGIPLGGMPGFAAKLGEEERWDLVNFLRCLASSAQARGLGTAVEPERPRVVAPDFAYAAGPEAERSLKEFRGQRAVLLILFSLPGSRDRLVALARYHETLRALGGEILAVPLDGGAGILTRLGGRPPILLPVVTGGSEEITAAYGLFRRTLAPDGLRPDLPVPEHMEILIDRQGYVRARWIPGRAAPGWADPAALFVELQRLGRERPGPLPAEHVH
ncbi:MAG: CopD family protein [Candidatus Rokubacteria bacterium]|nr:CopD family protein [Candidatus Rokubacteria bacterium]MBI3107128.1 CopD family protein [Candidatus Rokubacteria bacterium]